ncbi:MAG: hypothetical protein KGL39_43440 [Patescibacteria group bacterium]|nr:hypothetical protein [Patescibacteria group bacterium]
MTRLSEERLDAMSVPNRGWDGVPTSMEAIELIRGYRASVALEDTAANAWDAQHAWELRVEALEAMLREWVAHADPVHVDVFADYCEECEALHDRTEALLAGGGQREDRAEAHKEEA